MSFNWKQEHTQTFLEMYKNYECLWNNKCAMYSKKNVRDNAYKCLMSELNLPDLTINDIKAKIKTIRTRYCSELAKIRKSEKSGAGSSDLYVPRLFWFKEADSFLRGVCTPKESSSNLQILPKKDSKDQSAESSHEADELEEEGITNEVQYVDFTEDTTSEIPEIPPSTKHSNKRVASNNIESIHGAINKLAKISGENKKQKPAHEFDVFCNSLAIQLKKMPLQQALICQGKLQEVMTKHRLSLLHSENSSSPLEFYISTPSSFHGQSSHGYYEETYDNNENDSLMSPQISNKSEFNEP